ncbi:NAD(P)/FAD-dependent oxidoreductase [Sphingopyxis sp. GC21]|uniref:NAD(P)/FAD-dependent oxidoreductase n=1 Tax=Sphingopyxis sp. GC21 TaxID=2933562 RepID=UPI0021E4ABA6|nr:FAD-dependent oxidoreductase [Sphingopyxis sp. GC21]
MKQPLFDILVVGGGHGGAQVAINLRQGGFTGSIAIVSDETEFPYERPPLSKEYFAGEKSVERIRLRPPAFWDDKRISLILGERVIEIDPAARQVTTRTGSRLRYGKLVWAAGGSPRCLPLVGSGRDNVLCIRTLADADRLKALAEKAARVVVIGGGYIGLEAAAVLRKAGKQVVLLEVLDRVLARAAGAELAHFVENYHRDRGVDVRLGTGVSALEGEGAIEAVRLSDGERIACDLLIVGIGIVPAIEPLEAAGAACPNGVLVDRFCRTSLPDIFAVGDCAAHANVYAGSAVIRLESVQNAVDMAKTVSATILGNAAAYEAVPWFWSHQFDLRIQTVGLSMGHDAAVLRGDPATGSFSVVYLKDGRVIALDCVNATKDYTQGKALVVSGAQILPDILADANRPLKELQPA